MFTGAIPVEHYSLQRRRDYGDHQTALTASFLDPTEPPSPPPPEPGHEPTRARPAQLTRSASQSCLLACLRCAKVLRCAALDRDGESLPCPTAVGGSHGAFGRECRFVISPERAD